GRQLHRQILDLAEDFKVSRVAALFQPSDPVAHGANGLRQFFVPCSPNTAFVFGPRDFSQGLHIRLLYFLKYSDRDRGFGAPSFNTRTGAGRRGFTIEPGSVLVTFRTPGSLDISRSTSDCCAGVAVRCSFTCSTRERTGGAAVSSDATASRRIGEV